MRNEWARIPIAKYREDYWGLLRIGDPYLGMFYSTDDGCRKLAAAIARERSKRARHHWSFDPNRLIGLKQRLIIMRYFRRYGKYIWRAAA